MTQAQTAAKQAQAKLTAAQKALADAQTAKQQADDALAAAKEQQKQAQSAYNQAIKNGAKPVAAAVVTDNQITLPANYMSLLKAYFGGNLSSEALANQLASWMDKNTFKHSAADQQVKLNNVFDLNEATRTELSKWAAGLINQIRQQTGYPAVIVTTSSVAYAHEITQGYTTDNFNNFAVPTAHDYKVLKAVADRYGTQYEEDLSAETIPGTDKVWVNPTAHAETNGWQTVKTSLTLDQLKELIYDGLKGFLFEDAKMHWLHAKSISGLINAGLPQDHQQALGVDMGQDGWLHFDFGMTTTNGAHSKIADNATPANPAADQAKHNLDVANTNVQNATDKANDASIKVATAQKNVTDAENQVKTTKEAVTNAENQVKQFQGTQTEKEAALTKAKQDLATAESDLNKAKAAATDPQAKYEAAQANLTKAQADLQAALEKLALLKQQLSDLENAPVNLAKAQAELTAAKAAWSAAQAALPELQAQADAAQAALAKAEALYKAAVEVLQAAQAKAAAAKAALAAKAAQVAALKWVEAQAAAMKHQAHQAALPQTGEATPAVGWMSALGLAMVSMLTGTSLLKKRHN